jgi:hypothetical protein
MKATIPATMKITATAAWSNFHQPRTSTMTPNSSTPAAIATHPNRMEIALTDV